MDRNALVVLTTFEAVEERDLQKLFATFYDDVEFHEAPSLPYGGVSRGKTAMWARLQTAPETTWLGTWGPLQPTGAERRMDPRVVATGGREVTIAYTQRGLNANGERFDSPVVGLYTVVAGKLARAQMFHYDTAAILAFSSAVQSGSSSTAPTARPTSPRRPGGSGAPAIRWRRAAP